MIALLIALLAAPMPAPKHCLITCSRTYDGAGYVCWYDELAVCGPAGECPARADVTCEPRSKPLWLWSDPS